ncbi:MAG TPA: urease accessory protein UreF [Rhodopila sp.]|nr:urease accessory protein UreF [Rhodopila sp.]
MADTITTMATMTTIRTTEGIHHEGTKARSLGKVGAAEGGTTGIALLRLMAWLSPGFPTGAFAYSHGLEWAVEGGDVCNEMTLQAWLADVVRFGAGRPDSILLRQAHRACGDPEALTVVAAIACATASGRERQGESLDQGRAFMLAAAPWGIPGAPERIPYPVAVGAVAGAHDIPEDAAAAAFLQAFTTNLISAAVRLVPLGQTAGLRVLAAMEATILAVAAETKSATLDDLGGCAFRSDLAAMRHETQYTRLFRS